MGVMQHACCLILAAPLARLPEDRVGGLKRATPAPNLRHMDKPWLTAEQANSYHEDNQPPDRERL